MSGTPEPVPAGTYLGFDFGLRRIGVAVGESITRSARPLTTLLCRDGNPDWERVAALIEEWQPRALVVGLPRNDDGSDSALTPQAERFARRLHGRFGLTVHTADERLSSHAAERHLAETGRGGRKLAKRKETIDSLAAAIILESWLQEQHE